VSHDTPTNTAAMLPRWLHIWAVLTVVSAICAITGGAVVTTLKVGMADQVWPTYPWHLALISWNEPSAGFLIEHTHRLLAYTAGFCVVVLTVGLWWNRCLPWLRYTCLIAIIIQGLLGGFRVRLDVWLGSDLKLIHGSFAQIVFALAVSAAVMTSRSWREAGALADQRWRRVASPGKSFVHSGHLFANCPGGLCQTHEFVTWGQRGHLLVAFIVVATVALPASSPNRRCSRVGAALAAGSLVSGGDCWRFKFCWVLRPG